MSIEPAKLKVEGAAEQMSFVRNAASKGEAVSSDPLQEICQRLSRIEALLESLLEQRTVKEWYSPEELSVILHKSAYTVREWCRQGRIHGEKRQCGRGPTKEWIISHEELLRIQNHGLLPQPTISTVIK